jgi:hypothetical protein
MPVPIVRAGRGLAIIPALIGISRILFSCTDKFEGQ